MQDLDEKVLRYTLVFCLKAGIQMDTAQLRAGILRHMETARAAVSDDTLEKLGHVHLALMINTAARYGLQLGEVVTEAALTGSLSVVTLCETVSSRKRGTSKVRTRPHLRLV